MPTLLITGTTAFLVTFFALPAIIKIADAKRLFDLPDIRKVHRNPIASLGGVGMFTGFFLADLLFISDTSFPEFRFIYAAVVLVFFLGLKDDILVISASKKFIGQLVAVALLVHLAGLRIDSMHGLFGLRQLPQALSLALSYITMLLIINAYNLIDGIDGLAGMLGLVTMGAFGFYFYQAGFLPYALLALSMLGSLLAFLLFNYHPARIFMGDCGSLLLGLFNAILVVKFLAVAQLPGTAFPIESPVPLAIAVLIVPLVDTLRVFGLRILSGRSPFSPDRNHIHHLLLRRGLSHQQVSLCCISLNLGFVVFAFLAQSLGSSIMLCTMAMLVFGLLALLVYFPKPITAAKTGRIRMQLKQAATPATKLVAFSREAAGSVGK